MFERILGIVLSSHTIDLCQVNKGLNFMEVTHSISLPLPSEIKVDRIKEIGSFIRDICSRNNIKPDIVYSAIPSRASMLRHLHLPFTDMNKIAKVYPYEIEQTLPCSLDDVVMDYHIIESDHSSGTDILVAILPKKTLEEHLDILKSAGIEPRATTLEPVGLFFLNKTFFKKDKLVECIIDLGAKKATIILINKEKILMAREIDRFENDEDISNLCDQISLTLTSFMTDSDLNVEKITLIGDFTLISKLENLLFERMGIKIRSLFSYKGLPIKLSGNGAGRASFLAAPLGLCVGKKFKKGETWNFRQAEYAYQKTYTIPRKKALILGISALIIIILGFMNMAARSGLYKNRLGLLENEANTILSQTVPNIKWGPDTISQLKKKIDQELEIQKQYRFFFDEGPNAIDILRELSIRIPKEYEIIIQEVLYQQDKVRIKGKVETFEMLEKVKKGLSESKIFQGINIEQANIKGKGNQVSVNLILELKKSDKGEDQ
ncbi:MAG: pilus assembly protein PilM [bacterium]